MSNPFLPDDSAIPPQVPPQPSYPQLPPGYSTSSKSTTSVLAILSLVAGIAGVITCCCWPVSGAMGVVGIVLGHVALITIKGEKGRVQGKSLAYVGLGLGYFSLLLMVLAIIWSIVMPPERREQWMTPEKKAFDHADDMIGNDSHGVAQGNSPEAIALAQKFTTVMQQMRDRLFTKRKKGAISLSGNKFITYCELHEGKCVFLVHVPAYKDFDDDAKESLAEIAWAAAQQSVEGTLEEGDELAVGMKGVLLYGAIMVGEVVNDPVELKSGIVRETTISKEWLLPFFKPPDSNEQGEVK